MGLLKDDSYDVTPYGVTIAFGVTLDVVGIVNSKFLLYTDEATPVLIADPFEEIDLSEDYNSIYRTLELRWKDGVLSPETAYKIGFQNLKTASGVLVPNQSDTWICFSTGASATPSEADLPVVPVRTIIDHSLVSDIFTSPPVSQSSFSFVESDPVKGEYYTEEDHNDGVIEIELSDRPLESSVNTSNVRVQRKPIQRAPSRWEQVAADVSLSVDNPVIVISMPAIDHFPETATPYDDGGIPTYATSGFKYFESNYKYRVIVSKNILLESDETALGTDAVIEFAAGLDPLYVSPEELVAMFPEATLLEAAEVIHRASLEVREILRLRDDEVPVWIAIDYVLASAACIMSRVHDMISGGGGELSIRLGDLSVTNTGFSKSKINRGNATSPCELAAAFRTELLLKSTKCRATVRGSIYLNPIPNRRLKSSDDIPRIKVEQGRLDDNH